MIQNSSLSLHFLKNYFEMIKEIGEENSSESEQIKKESVESLLISSSIIFLRKRNFNSGASIDAQKCLPWFLNYL